MSDSQPSSGKTYTEQATDALKNVQQAVSNTLSGDGKPAETQPTVGSKLGEAWESVKEATGIAATNTDEQLDKTKAKAELKQAETKEQLEAARTDINAKKAEAGETAAQFVKDAREDLAAKISPNK